MIEIMENILSKIKQKATFGSRKKFNNLSFEVQSSALRISQKIANVVGWENIIIEKEECDIFFEDHFDYYIEIKTPQLFKQDFGDKLVRLNNELLEIIDASKRPLVGIHVFNFKDLKIVTNTKIPVERDAKSFGIINYDSNLIPDELIFRKIDILLEGAAAQFEKKNVQGGKLWVIIDVTFNFVDIKRAFYNLKKVILDTDIMERIDGVSLFYLNQIKVNVEEVPFTIGPTIVNNLENISKVFDHPYHSYIGNLIITSPELFSSTGILNLDKLSSKQFYKTLFELSKYDSNPTSSATRKFLTLLDK